MWIVKEREREEMLQQQNREQGIVSQEENQEENKQEEHKIHICTRLYYNKVIRGLIVIIAVAIIIPVFLLLFMDTVDPDFDETHTCSMEAGYQISCGVQSTTFEKCSALKCCFNETDKTCYHKVSSYYQYTQKEDTSDTNLFHPLEEQSPFGVNNIPVYLQIKPESSYKLSITLSTEQMENDKEEKTYFANEEYSVKVFKHMMGVDVNRTQSYKRLLTTTRGPVIISDKYWEWTIDLFAEHLFGMDMLRIPDNERLTKVIYKNAEDHSSVLRFMAYNSSQFHGLEIEHTGLMQVITTEAKLIVLRLLSGSKLTLKLSTGPTPTDIMRQFRGNEDWTPIPHWVLGVHICRDGNNSNINEILKEVEDFQKNSNFPYDSDCIYENLFSLSNYKNNAKVDAMVKKIKTTKKFLMSLSPQVLVENTPGSYYEKAQQMGILYTKDNEIVKGKYLNKSVAFPDYSSPKAEKWFKDMYNRQLAHLHADGFILRNSWPVNDEYDMKSGDEFQYMPKEVKHALSRTLPWDSVNSFSVPHINIHNLYGLDYANVIAKQTKSQFILSGTFTQGSHFSAHIQNINASWVNFKQILRKTLSHSLFGGSMFSVPVCGDTRNFSKSLNRGACQRWYLTAATMPLFRISSDLPRRDPTSYDDVQHTKNIMIDAIKIRYTFLPYFYTVLSENLPMVRPTFFNFPDDTKTFDLDEQYMIGEALLIAQPSLFPIPNMQVYLPKIPGGWFEFWGGMKTLQTGWITVPIIENDLVLFIAAGKIVPLHNEIDNSVEETHKKPLNIVIALHCSKENKITCSAKGTLYITNAKNSILVEFAANEKSLSVSHVELCQQDTTPDFAISKLQIYSDDFNLFGVPIEKSQFCIKRNGKIQLDYSQLSPM